MAVDYIMKTSHASMEQRLRSRRHATAETATGLLSRSEGGKSKAFTSHCCLIALGLSCHGLA